MGEHESTSEPSLVSLRGRLDREELTRADNEEILHALN